MGERKMAVNQLPHLILILDVGRGDGPRSQYPTYVRKVFECL